MRYLWIALWLTAVCGTEQAARAQTNCGTSSLQGTYFYVLSGNYYNGGQFVPYAEVGRFVADGNGGIVGQSTASIGLNPGPVALNGNYAVAGNCTGTMALNTLALNLQIVSGGESVLLASSATNFVVTGEAFVAAASSGGSCASGSLHGNYGYVMSGQISLTSGDYYYSQAGQLVADGQGHLTDANVYDLGGGGQSSNGSGTYTINPDCSGTAQLVYREGTYNYNIALAQGNNLLLLETDSGTGVAGTGQLQSTGGVVLPQFVFGAGTWYSALYLTNSNSNPVTFTVNFNADGGTPLAVPSLGGSSVPVTIAPNGTAVLEAPNSGSFGDGYASLLLPMGVSGYGIFRQTVAGRPDQEAVVPLASASSTRNTLAWDETGNAVTSVAIANPSNVANSVTITVWDTNGTLLGTSPPLAVAAAGKIEGGLDSLSGLNLSGKRGSAQFTVATGNVAVLGLRFSGVAFTSIPTVGN